MNSEPVKVKYTFHTTRKALGAPVLMKPGPAPKKMPKTRIPRISRLMALAHRFAGLLETKQVTSHDDLTGGPIQGTFTRYKYTIAYVTEHRNKDRSYANPCS